MVCDYVTSCCVTHGECFAFSGSYLSCPQTEAWFFVTVDIDSQLERV